MIDAYRFMRHTAIGLAATLLTTSAFAQYSTPVRDVENPARTPIQEKGNTSMPPNFVGVAGEPLVDIPANQRLVIEEVSVRCFTPPGSSMLTAAIATVHNTGSSSFTTQSFDIPITFKGTDAFNGPVYVGHLSTRLYADHPFVGSAVTMAITRDHGVDTATCFFSLSGYTVQI